MGSAQWAGAWPIVGGMTEQTTLATGPDLPQRRNLVTEIPGKVVGMKSNVPSFRLGMNSEPSCMAGQRLAPKTPSAIRMVNVFTTVPAIVYWTIVLVFGPSVQSLAVTFWKPMNTLLPSIVIESGAIWVCVPAANRAKTEILRPGSPG